MHRINREYPLELHSTVQSCRTFLQVFFLWFALWTLGANAVAITGSNAVLLQVWLPASVSLAILLIRQLNRSKGPDKQVALQPRPIHCNSKLARGTTALVVLMSLGTAIATYKFHHQAIVVSGFSVILVLCFLVLKVSPLDRGYLTNNLAPHGSARENLLLAGLSTLVVALYLFGHQPDGDDANYINLAIGAFRSESGVFLLDTMLGDGPTAIHLPTYRVHSYELLLGTLSASLPGETLFYAHILVPGVFAGVFALCLYYVYRSLLGTAWLVGALLHLSFLVLAFGDNFQSLGAHGLFRFFQGKAFFIQAIVPLTLIVVIQQFNRFEPRNLLLLICLQISSVGLTANGIFAAPLALGLAAFAGLLAQGLNADNIRNMFRIMSCSVYPLVVGVYFILAGEAYPSQFEIPAAGSSQATAIFSYFGWSLLGLLAMACIPVAIYMVGFFYRTNYFAYYFLGLLLFIFNPLVWPIFNQVTGNLSFRIFWSIPFPMLFALGFSCLGIQLMRALPLFQVRNGQTAVSVTSFAVLLALLWINTDNHRLNPVDWSMPGYRVVENDFHLARFIAGQAKPDTTVLVPTTVARYITTLDNHPYPVAVSNLYQTHYRHTMDGDEIALRSQLLNSLDPKEPTLIDVATIVIGIREFDIGTILLPADNINRAAYLAACASQSCQTSTVNNQTILKFNSPGASG